MTHRFPQTPCVYYKYQTYQLRVQILLVLLLRKPINKFFYKGTIDRETDGFDQWDTLQGDNEESPRGEILLNIHKQSKKRQEALIVGKWKIIMESKMIYNSLYFYPAFLSMRTTSL